MFGSDRICFAVNFIASSTFVISFFTFFVSPSLRKERVKILPKKEEEEEEEEDGRRKKEGKGEQHRTVPTVAVYYLLFNYKKKKI